MSNVNVLNASKVVENLLKSSNFKIQLEKWIYSLSETEVDNLLIKVELKTESGLNGKLDRLKR